MCEEATPPTDAGASPCYSENYRSKFMAIFDELVQELTVEGLKNPEISPGIQRLEEVSEFAIMRTP